MLPVDRCQAVFDILFFDHFPSFAVLVNGGKEKVWVSWIYPLSLEVIADWFALGIRFL